MENGKEKIVLAGLLAAAILIGLGFWAYYASQKTPGPRPAENLGGTASTSPAAAAYLKNLSVKLTNEVYPTDIYQPNPRLKTYTGKVQNNGERTINYLSIKIVFLDKNEKPIWEQDVPVSATLKPHFIAEFPFGGLKVPSEWAGRADYQITEIRFRDDKSNETFTYPDRYHRAPLDRPLQQILIFPND